MSIFNKKYYLDDEVTNYGRIFPGYENAVNFAIKVLMKELEIFLDEYIEDMDI